MLVAWRADDSDRRGRARRPGQGSAAGAALLGGWDDPAVVALSLLAWSEATSAEPNDGGLGFIMAACIVAMFAVPVWAVTLVLALVRLVRRLLGR